MPFSSKAQAAAMHAAAAGKSTLDIPRSVGQKFVAEGHGSDVGKLPEHKRKGKKKGGQFTLPRTKPRTP